MTPLQAAAQNAYPAVVRVLLDKGAHVEEKDPRGRTCLHYVACQYEISLKMLSDLRTSIAVALLSSGAKVNATDLEGRTPLHAAAAR